MFARTTDGASTRETVSRLVAWCIYETHLLCVSHVTVARCQRGRPLGGTSGSNSFDPGAEFVYCTVRTHLSARAGRSILSHLG